jgi:hypothetical protein
VTWTAVGSALGGATANLSTNNQAVGNLLIVEVINDSNSTVWATGLSGGGASWVAAGVKFSGTTNAKSAAVFFGTVTATGAGTATISWSGTAPATWSTAGQEFHSTAGSWAFDKQGNLDSGGTSNWPSLTPAGTGELYWGFISDSGSSVAGSTSGYTYNANADTTSDGMAYNLSVSSASFPVWGDAGQQFGIVILVAESAASSFPAVPRQANRYWNKRRRRPQTRVPSYPPPFEGWGVPL